MRAPTPQPLMYKKIKAHKSCHLVYKEQLLAEDTIHQVGGAEISHVPPSHTSSFDQASYHMICKDG